MPNKNAPWEGKLIPKGNDRLYSAVCQSVGGQSFNFSPVNSRRLFVRDNFTALTVLVSKTYFTHALASLFYI